MSHNHDHEVSQVDLYEGDQSKLYSGVFNHSQGGIDSAESKKQVKKIWLITLLLSIVTIAEVAVGLWAFNSGVHNYTLITYFLVLTLVKAFYITKVFMHLGDEDNNFVMLVLIPLYMILWIALALMMDGSYGLMMNSTFAETIKDLLP